MEGKEGVLQRSETKTEGDNSVASYQSSRSILLRNKTTSAACGFGIFDIYPFIFDMFLTKRTHFKNRQNHANSF